MTDRRSHWDASLISAVLADLRDVYDSGYGEEQAFRIIAAVEDWIDARGSAIDGREVVAAIAAIQRVRALCSQSRAVVSRGCSCHADECSGTCGAGRPLAWGLDPADVLNALDGDSHE